MPWTVIRSVCLSGAAALLIGCGDAPWTKRELEARTVGVGGVQVQLQAPPGLTETRISDTMVKLGTMPGGGEVRPEINIGVDSPPHIPAEAEAVSRTPDATHFRMLGSGVAVDVEGTSNIGLRAWLPFDPAHSVRCEITLYGGKSRPGESVEERRAWMERVCSSLGPAP